MVMTLTIFWGSSLEGPSNRYRVLGIREPEPGSFLSGQLHKARIFEGNPFMYFLGRTVQLLTPEPEENAGAYTVAFGHIVQVLVYSLQLV